MFNAIADQLAIIGLIPSDQAEDPRYIRRAAASYMAAHADDFMPFLPSVTGEDSADATQDGMMTEKGFKKYCSNVAETGEWGGEPEVSIHLRTLKLNGRSKHCRELSRCLFMLYNEAHQQSFPMVEMMIALEEACRLNNQLHRVIEWFGSVITRGCTAWER